MDLTLDKKLQGFQLVAQEKVKTSETIQIITITMNPLQLCSILCSIPGKKELILEPELIKPLEHVVTASWLK